MPVEEGEFLSPSLLGPSFSHAHPLSSSGFQSHAGSSFLQRDWLKETKGTGHWVRQCAKTTQGLSSELSESVLSCSFLGGLCSFNTSLLRVWLLDQPHRHCLGACLQCRIPGPTPNRLKQNLQFNKIHQRFVCSGKSEKQCFRLQPSGKFSLFGWLLNVQWEEVSQVPCVSPESQAKGEPCLRRWRSDFAWRSLWNACSAVGCWGSFFFWQWFKWLYFWGSRPWDVFVKWRGNGACPSGEERAHRAEAMIIIIKCWKTLRRNRNQACSCEGRRKTFRMIPSSWKRAC